MTTYNRQRRAANPKRTAAEIARAYEVRKAREVADPALRTRRLMLAELWKRAHRREAATKPPADPKGRHYDYDDS